MSQIKEIKNRMDGISETYKITSAMYLIASVKLRRAKEGWDRTEPYFRAIQSEVKRIFRTVGKIDSPYFYPSADDHLLEGTYGYLIVTADKGLAGAYNQNVIREAERMLREHSDAKLFVVGEYGRHYCRTHGIAVEQDFLYTAQNPTLHRAREISDALLAAYDAGKLKKLYVTYTDYTHGGEPEVRTTRILPFHHGQFDAVDGERAVERPFAFEPSVGQVLENIIGSYVTGFVYSALTDSFCCEQSARMAAMDSASRNAQKLLEEMSLQHQHARQNTITREITEIASGAQYQRKKKNEQAGGEEIL